MEYERVKWACRRGMLELDLIFEPYVLGRYPSAAEEDKKLFIAFLSENDQDLFDWLLQKKPVPSSELQRMVNILLNDDRH